MKSPQTKSLNPPLLVLPRYSLCETREITSVAMKIGAGESVFADIFLPIRQVALMVIREYNINV